MRSGLPWLGAAMAARGVDGKATDAEIGLFNVDPEDADQVLQIYELLVAFGNGVANTARNGT